MNMKPKRTLLLLILGTLFLAACNQTVASNANGEATPTPELTATITPTPELTATITPTATIGAPLVTVSQTSQCRTGPSPAFEILGELLVGEIGEVVGLGQDVDGVIINNPDAAGTCWLWLQFATLVGDTSQLPVMTPPPPP